MISRILTAIRSVLAASVRALAAFGDEILSLPWHLKEMLYGPSPVGPSADNVADVGEPVGIGPEARRRAMVERGLLPLDIEPGPDGRDPLGELIKQYAATEPSKRDFINLDKLSGPQVAWLTSLSEGDLAKLATANAIHCGRLVRGRKTSVTGVDRFRDDREYRVDQRRSPAPPPEPALLQRVRKLTREREEERTAGLAFAA